MLITENSLLNAYLDHSGYDEMYSPEKKIHPAWKELMTNVLDIGPEALESRQNDLNWHLRENGVTYNIYNDPQGMNRPWILNSIPTVISEDEWQTIEKGLKQRAEILNLILEDVYGKRDLIKNGIVPQEVIFSHAGFLRQCNEIEYNSKKTLLILSVDMARGPDGQMWIINDRSQAPSGMGYALENRLTMGHVNPDLFKNLHIKKLAQFFYQFNELLIDSAPGNKDNPNIVVLTPGPHNETYFEHAYLASFLGYPLVQGNDLIVRKGKLYMKSMKGLKRVDVLLRRVDDVFSDPLELKEDSHLGVAGLLEAVRRKNVSVVNPVGCQVLENPGLIPFMPAICKYFLGEDLILPQIATWWCGQDKEKNYVLENLNKLIIKKIDRAGSNSTFVGELLNQNELLELKGSILKKPYRYVAQEKISFSTVPTYYNGNIEPRNSVWRTFVIANKDQYSVMPGGLVRVAPEKGDIMVSNQTGGISKDIWILDNSENHEQSSYIKRKPLKPISDLDDLPSLTAENLFWAGRYVARSLDTARYLRMVLNQMTYSHYDEQNIKKESFIHLCSAVTHLTNTYPGFLWEKEKDKIISPTKEIYSVILDKNRVGSLSFTLSMFYNSYYSVRNLWSSDMWRVFERIQNKWCDLQNDPELNIRKIIHALDQLITRLIAFMGLVEESILIDQGLLLYYIGLRLEHSLLNITKNRALLVNVQHIQVEYEILEALLKSHESLKVYRYTYKSYINIENVINLLLFDLKYPRSLVYQLNELINDLSQLPNSNLTGDLTNYEKYAFNAFSKIRLADTSELIMPDESGFVRQKMDDLLSDMDDLLYQTSISLTSTYFSHTYKQNQLVKQILPV